MPDAGNTRIKKEIALSLKILQFRDGKRCVET